MSPSLHLAVALDGAGWHPAAWREPGARPRGAVQAPVLGRPGRRGRARPAGLRHHRGRARPAVRLPRPARRPGRPGRGAASTPSWSRPGSRRLTGTSAWCRRSTRHPHRAVPRLQGHRHPRLRQHRAGRRARPGLGPAPRPRHFGRRDVPDAAPGRTWDRRIGRAIDDLFDEAADYVEVLRRLWDSWEDDAEIRDVATGRFVDREKLHYIDFEGRWFAVKGPSITPRPPQGQPLVAALAHVDGAVPASPPAAPTSCSSPRTTPHARPRAIAAEIAGARQPAGRPPERRCGSSPTWWCSSTTTRARPRAPQGSPRRAGRWRAAQRRRWSSPGPRPSWPTLLVGWRRGRAGRLPAAAGGHAARPVAITRGLVPELQRRGAVPRRPTSRGTLRGPARPAPTRQPLRHARGGQIRGPRMAPSSRSTSPRTSRASTTPPSGATRPRAATSSSPRSPTWPGPPSGPSSTSSSWPRGCGCASRRGQIYDLDVVGRPDTFTVLAALAARDRADRAWPAPSTRRSTSPTRWPGSSPRLDHLSGGRAAWNVVTSWDAFTGENFRRGGYLPEDERYERAQEFMRDRPGAVGLVGRGRDRRRPGDRGVPAPARRRGVRAPRRPVRHRRPVHRAAQPAGPAGDLPGRRLRGGPRVRGRDRRRDLHPARHARRRPGVLRRRKGDGWPASAGRPRSSRSCRRPRSSSATPTPRPQERARQVRRQQVEPARPRSCCSSSSGTATCPSYDPDGPLPADRPGPSATTPSPGPGQRADVPGPGGHGRRVARAGPRPRAVASAS